MFSNTTIVIPSLSNLLQVCSSISAFIFAVLFIPFFQCFEWIFLYFTKSGGSSYCFEILNFDKFRDNIYLHGKKSSVFSSSVIIFLINKILKVAMHVLF